MARLGSGGAPGRRVPATGWLIAGTCNPPVAGWDVPGGFTPDSACTADPSCPPAPAGWLAVPEAGGRVGARQGRRFPPVVDDQGQSGREPGTSTAQLLAAPAAEQTRAMDQGRWTALGRCRSARCGAASAMRRAATPSSPGTRIARSAPSRQVGCRPAGGRTGGRGSHSHEVRLLGAGQAWSVVPRRDGPRIGQHDRARRRCRVRWSAAAPPRRHPGPSIMSQIRQLAELRDTGLTATEERGVTADRRARP